MPNLDLPIVIVDDAKFSSTVIAKTLTTSGYRDVRVVNDGQSAIQQLEKRKTSVLVADWLMPGMDGLELTRKVRQLDEQSNHFTYIILLTGKETPEALQEAFEKGVDDFIFKSDMSRQLLPRVYAADRMADHQNSLLIANKLLLENNRHLEQNNMLDPETGVGNQRMAHDSLTRQLKHTESRGGVTCYVRLEIQDWQLNRHHQNYILSQELSASITRRLRGLIRPLDVLCRIMDDTYVIVAQFNQLEHCKVSVFKRILDGINHTSFRTSSGFHNVKCILSVCCIGDKGPLPTSDQVEQECIAQLGQARQSKSLSVFHWDGLKTEA